MPDARQSTFACLAPAAFATAALCGLAHAGPVDLIFVPTTQTVGECDLVQIELVMSTPDKAGQLVGGLDAIIAWDPAFLELEGFVPGPAWSTSGFLNDPDDINDDITDGLALYTALAPPPVPVLAPPQPDSALITTFEFRALTGPSLTTLSLERSFGTFGRTQVLLVADNVTGDISSTSNMTIGTCTADLNADDSVGFADLQILLQSWGPCPPGECCAPDLNDDGSIGFADLQMLLQDWGACP